MLKGNIVALVTPFKENKKINYAKFIELLEYQINNGVDGIVILGTTGEASSLNEKEQIKLIKLAITVINKRVKLIVGASAINTSLAIKKIQKFSKYKIDYLLVLSPFYLKTNNEGLIKHFLAIADISKIPIIIYHVPSRTGQKIPFEVIKELAKNKMIIGIKEASGDLNYIKGIKKYIDDEFILLSGNDDLMVKVMEEGGSGVISVFANTHSNVTSEIMELCFKAKYKEAEKILNKYLDYIKLLFIEPNPIPIKEAMNYLGFEVGGYRLPLANMSMTYKQVLIEELKEINNENSNSR